MLPKTEDIDSNVSLISPETSVELSEVSVDSSKRNASVAKTRKFELLCVCQKNEGQFEHSPDQLVRFFLASLN
jgi:hypothetical protein